MEPLYDTNGLVLWDEAEIAAREHLTAHLAREIRKPPPLDHSGVAVLPSGSPTLTPRGLINPNYGDADLWTQPDTDLVLRPERRWAAALYARKLLADKGGLMPFCIWQAGKSYRKEQDKSLAKMVSKNSGSRSIPVPLFRDDQGGLPIACHGAAGGPPGRSCEPFNADRGE